MKQKMIASVSLSYGTRRLVAGDEFMAPRRDARILAALGRARLADVLEPQYPPVPEPAALEMLRAEYERKLGKRAYHGWDEDTLREKIADAQTKED